jgi:hypothetical protein
MTPAMVEEIGDIPGHTYYVYFISINASYRDDEN